MKRIAPLFLLSLLLAACGQPSTPGPAAISSGLGHTAASGPNYVTSFEAGVARDLAALGLSGQLTGQAAAPKSYLNVLRVNDSNARAYLKTTYPAATGCTLDWGDGSSAAINTPSTVATDKQDHIYAQSGSYTIKLTCGTNIKTSSFTATVTSNGLGLFDDYVGDFFDYGYGDESYTGSSYVTNGFTFKADRIFMERNGWGLPQGHTGIVLDCFGGNGYFNTTDGYSFNIASISAAGLYYGVVQITGYDSDNQIIGTAQFARLSGNADPIETQTLGWNNVNKVVCSGSEYFHMDDMVATINTP